MRLTFRQGILRYQTDVYSTPTFLQKSSQTGEYINLVVSPDPTIIAFAHRGATYIVEESKSVQQAWGPFSQGGSKYLFWDINLLSGALTRGFTSLPQIVSTTPPVNPAEDQHWFDKSQHLMRVWNGTKWIEKIRVFAATYSSQAIIVPESLGSQAAEVGEFDGGNIVLDAYNKPLRQSDGSFVTSATDLAIINAATKKVRFEAEIVNGMAEEYIPKFSLVQITPGSMLRLARSNDWKSRIVGIVLEDLYQSEVGLVTVDGLVRNEQWNWPAESIGRPIFCGITGEVTLTPPQVGVSQVAGFVYSTDSVILDVHNVTILDVPAETPAPPIPTPAPIANFTASVQAGVAPLTVQFGNTSLNGPSTLAWDFNNDGTVDSTLPDPVFTYSSPGTYTVRLTATNNFGQDSEVKSDFIVVDSAQIPDQLTNLEIQLNGPLQVTPNQTFAINVVVSNAGFKTATDVARIIEIDDIGSQALQLTNLPTGSTTTRGNAMTVLSLPSIPTVQSGQFVTSSFTISASSLGTANIRGMVGSQESDSTMSDNSTSLSIKVKL